MRVEDAQDWNKPISNIVRKLVAQMKLVKTLLKSN